MNIGIVRALYHAHYTEDMLDVAKREARENEMDVKYVLNVPGAHDVALGAKKLLKRADIDGVIVLGVVIKGSTDHDEVIMHNISKQLMELSCHHEKPIGFGIMGPNISWAQAEERVESYARQAVDAVYDTHEEMHKLDRIE